MEENKVAAYRRCVRAIGRKFYSTAGVLSITGMVGLIVVDVVLRYVFNRPISSSHEIVMYLLTIVVFSAFSYATVEKSHVMVELVISRLPGRARLVIEIVVSFLGVGLFTLIAEQSVVRGIALRAENLTSSILHIPTYPFLFIIAFSSALVALTLLGDVMKSLRREE